MAILAFCHSAVIGKDPAYTYTITIIFLAVGLPLILTTARHTGFKVIGCLLVLTRINIARATRTQRLVQDAQPPRAQAVTSRHNRSEQTHAPSKCYSSGRLSNADRRYDRILEPKPPKVSGATVPGSKDATTGTQEETIERIRKEQRIWLMAFGGLLIFGLTYDAVTRYYMGEMMEEMKRVFEETNKLLEEINKLLEEINKKLKEIHKEMRYIRKILENATAQKIP
ncbi:hypothetical protein Dda_4815 [Drechslerella dactyloides]|uniref:Uncharacterized protein n=1 Tax=Drechslerella dactyloides TaxID=74499 RepID=A0AAD6NJF6_DREDA|nr:hypothetical protein Dda_4815 [Drechslerella dactyloides]